MVSGVWHCYEIAKVFWQKCDSNISCLVSDGGDQMFGQFKAVEAVSAFLHLSG